MDYRTSNTFEHCKNLSNGISNYLIESLIPENWIDGKYPRSIKFNQRYVLESDESTFVVRKGDIFHVSVNTRAVLKISFESNNEFHNWSISDKYDYTILDWNAYPENHNMIK